MKVRSYSLRTFFVQNNLKPHTFKIAFLYFSIKQLIYLTMDSFNIDLNEMTNKKPRLIRMWLIGLVIFVLLFVFSFVILASRNHKVEWYYVAGIIYLGLYFYFAWSAYKNKLYIQADNFALEYKFGLLARSTKSIMWATIVKVKVGPTYINFFKKSGRKNTMKIGWLPYHKVVEIKDSIIKMAETLEIPVEKTEFIQPDNDNNL